MDPIPSAAFAEKTVLPSFNYFSTFDKSVDHVGAGLLIGSLHVPLISISITLLVLYCF